MTSTSDNSEVEALKEQIKLYQKQNQILLDFVEEAKTSRFSLEKQLELTHEREKLFLIREQRDYQRIVELEKKLELLAPPVPQEVNDFQTQDVSSSKDKEKDVTPEDSEPKPEDISPKTEDVSPKTKNQASEKEVTEEPPKPAETEAINDEEPPPEPEPDEETIEPIASEDSEETPAPENTETSSISEESSDAPEEESDTASPDTDSDSISAEPPENRTIPEVESSNESETESVDSSSTGGRSTEETEGRPREEDEPTSDETAASETEEDTANSESSDSAAPEPEEDSPESESDNSAANQTQIINDHFNRGLAAAGKKNYEEAIEAFIQVSELLPDAAPSFLNLAIIHFRMGHLTEAQYFTMQAIERGSEPAERLKVKIEDALTSKKPT